jgi:hypothetical protein
MRPALQIAERIFRDRLLRYSISFVSNRRSVIACKILAVR